MKKLAVLFFFGLVVVTAPMCVSAEMVFDQTDTFSVVFDTSLTGDYGDYGGYTENEHEERVYEISEITGNQVTWIMDREYSYSDSDGNSLEQENSYRFTINSETGAYVNSTYDAPSSYLSYYTFDYIWFRIDPETPVGDNVTILGNNYTVLGLTTIFTDMITAVDVIEVKAEDVHQVISSYDYDPDGSFTIIFDDTYYFDPTTGYFVYEVWEARGITSVGAFDWYETGRLTESSFQVQQNVEASIPRILFFAALVIGVVGLVVAGNHTLKKSYETSVLHAIRIMSGELKPPAPRGKNVAPMLWNPLHINYENLIQISQDIQYMTLQSGVYIVINPDNTIAIVDTQTNPRFQNLVFDFEETSIELLYKLALGTIDPNTVEYQEALTRIKDVKDHLQPAFSIAEPDSQSLFVFRKIDSSQTQEVIDGQYDEIATLLSRRKILDYSLGQAPLTPSSHILKLNHILKHQPQKVLLVGDDDLLSISLARRQIEVTLIEVDPYTCALIALIAAAENLNIRIHQIDLRASLPFLEEEFDLFVADPDFTIEAFALFLSRGLSLLRLGGVGLINFQDTRSQKYKAKFLLEQLNVEILDEAREKWHYAIIMNKTSSTYHGKYAPVTYTHDVRLLMAPYSSVMFTIRKSELTNVVLEANESLKGVESVIYDF